MKKNKELWSKDFTLITLGTIISAIAGEAISLPLSLLVFDQTSSTLLSGLLVAAGFLPSVILPIIIAPMIDNFPKKKMIIFLDFLTVIVFLFFGIWIGKIEFNYYIYLFFIIIMGIISITYQLAFNAWYPDLIKKGYEQQGFAIASMIYPTIMIFMTPLSVWLYEKVSMSKIFIIVAGLTLIAVLLELFIESDKKKYEDINIEFGIEQYKLDLKMGIDFLKEEEGIRNIYLYMSITQGISFGIGLMTQAYFQTAAYLTERMYSWIKSSETIGRFMGGLFHYKIDIPVNKRYGITKLVYIFYSIADLSLLFLGFPFMLINRFICGILGINSATIREASVQSYLPSNMRAKINAVFSTLIGLTTLIGQITAGALGEFLDYRYVIIIFTIIDLIAIYILIIRPNDSNKIVYESERI